MCHHCVTTKSTLNMDDMYHLIIMHIYRQAFEWTGKHNYTNGLLMSTATDNTFNYWTMHAELNYELSNLQMIYNCEMFSMKNSLGNSKSTKSIILLAYRNAISYRPCSKRKVLQIILNIYSRSRLWKLRNFSAFLLCSSLSCFPFLMTLSGKS